MGAYVTSTALSEIVLSLCNLVENRLPQCNDDEAHHRGNKNKYIHKSLDVFGNDSMGEQKNKLAIKPCQKKKENQFYEKDKNILVIFVPNQSKSSFVQVFFA